MKTNSELIIEVEKLYKTYRGSAQPAVNGVDLNVRRGSFFGLLGPNGAGKTTLLSMLAGLLKPDSGKIRVAGLDIRDDLAKIKNSLSVVPQDTALYPSLTARENMTYFGSMLGLSGSFLRLRTEECLKLSDLKSFADSKVATFSGGMKRRLSLFIGIIRKPEILFLDEPTVGIDPQSRHFIYETLRAINKEGTTIIYTSHYMEEAEELCDYIAIADQGRIIAQGETGYLLSHDKDKLINIRTSESLPILLQDKIKALPLIQEYNFNPRGFTIKSTAPQQTFTDLMVLLSQNNIIPTSISYGTANLEQLFLDLTGTRLRE